MNDIIATMNFNFSLELNIIKDYQSLQESFCYQPSVISILYSLSYELSTLELLIERTVLHPEAKLEDELSRLVLADIFIFSNNYYHTLCSNIVVGIALTIASDQENYHDNSNCFYNHENIFTHDSAQLCVQGCGQFIVNNY